jgi:N-methylhydantoinase A/oxoprolinase/acetone carboxylase beta subunit
MVQTPFRRAVTQLTAGELEPVLARMTAQLEHELESDGVPPDRRSFQVLGDLRYIGQFHEIVCEIPGRLLAPPDAAGLAELFHLRHTAQYGHCDAAAPVEIVNLRLEATGRLDTPDVTGASAGASASPQLARERRAVMDQSGEAHPVRVIDRSSLAAGQAVAGPAILVQRDATTIVLAGQQAVAGERGELRIREVRS